MYRHSCSRFVVSDYTVLRTSNFNLLKHLLMFHIFSVVVCSVCLSLKLLTVDYIIIITLFNIIIMNVQ